MSSEAGRSGREAGWRRDVDGLRGLAVAAVLVFHACAPALPGGFAGVDIFFVISGFVVGRGMLRDLAAGDFSFARFYARRARRLFPALLLVLLFTLAAAPFFMSMADYRDLGRQIAAACVFASNFLTWSQTGYFDGDAAYRPLIHLWSLAVEEQFYLCFPLLMWCVFAWKPQATGSVLRVTAALSFCLCFFVTEMDSDAAFYLPVTRFWELLVGASLAWWDHVAEDRSEQRLPPAAAWAGLGLIAASLVLLSEHQPFPGWRAVLPVAGAFLLLAAGEKAFVNRALLSAAPLRALGRISYGAYLWHWPLLVFARFHSDGALPPATAFALTALAIALAWLSERYVERPIRQGAALVRLRDARALWGGLVVAGVASVGVTAVAAARAPDTIMRLLTYPALAGDPWREKLACFTDYTVDQPASPLCSGDRKPGRPHVALWGDSHAAHLWPGVSAEAEKRGWSAGEHTASMCPPTLTGATQGNRHCVAIRERLLAAMLDPAPDVVVLAGRWRLYPELEVLAGVVQSIEYLRSKGVRRVVVIGPSPIWLPTLGKALVADMRRNKLAEPPLTTMTGFDVGAFDFEARFRAVVEKAGGYYESMLERSCAPRGPCRAWVDEDKKTMLTAFDAGHLTESYSREMVGKFAPGIFVAGGMARR